MDTIDQTDQTIDRQNQSFIHTRVPQGLHARAKMAALRSNRTLNQYIIDLIINDLTHGSIGDSSISQVANIQKGIRGKSLSKHSVNKGDEVAYTEPEGWA